MVSSERKKELRQAYKERPDVGGVYAIRCQSTGRVFLYAAPNPKGQRNRFDFSVSSGVCVHGVLSADWRTHGPGAFTFETLEELERGPEQTLQTFRADLEALKEIWREKLACEGAELYEPLKGGISCGRREN